MSEELSEQMKRMRENESRGFERNYLRAVAAFAALEEACLWIGLSGHPSLRSIGMTLLNHGAVTLKDIERDEATTTPESA